MWLCKEHLHTRPHCHTSFPGLNHCFEFCLGWFPPSFYVTSYFSYYKKAPTFDHKDDRKHLNELHHPHKKGPMSCQCHHPFFHITLESATLDRPNSWMTMLIRSFFSWFFIVVGSRRAAENCKFSLTVRVPITTSSLRQMAFLTRHIRSFVVLSIFSV